MTAHAQWSSSPSLNNAICQAGNNQVAPRIISDGKGGAIICWSDERVTSNSFDVYAQRIDKDGFIRWTVNGNVVSDATNSQVQPEIVSDDAGGAIIVWSDTRNGDNDIYAQRIDSTGKVLWGKDGVAVALGSTNQSDPKITTDGNHGAIMTWNDNSGGFPPVSKIYAQRIDAAGNLPWGSQVLVCGTLRFANAPTIASDGNGGAYISYAYFPRPDYDVYAQRLDASGKTQWPGNGVAIATGSSVQDSPQLFADGAGHAFLAYADWGAGSIANMQLVILKKDGTQAASFRPATTSGGQASPQMWIIRPGVMGVVWEDGRVAGKKKVFAQIVDSTGSIAWAVNGVEVSNRSGDQVSPLVVTDGVDGVIVSWEDKTKGANQSDIYAQHISGAGTVLWTSAGAPVCTADKIQQFPRMIPDGQNGTILTWEDYRPSFSNVEVYASKILADGSFPIGPPILSFSSKSEMFGGVGIGYSSTKNITITNIGGAAVTMASITPSDPHFTVTTDNTTIAPSGSVNAAIKFQPTSKEVLTARIVITSNSIFSPDTIVVTGWGTGSPSIRVDKNALSFGDVKVGASRAMAINVSNLGNDTLVISSITATNPRFTVDITSKTLYPGTAFDDTVRFNPTAVGPITGNLTLTSNAAGSPTTIPLSGTGVPVVSMTIDLADISFGTVPVGEFKDTTLTITNTGNDSLRIASFTSGDPSFTVETPITVIGPAGVKTVTLRFTPSAAGPVSSSFTVTSNAVSSPNTINVDGTGVLDPAISAPPQLSFGSVDIGKKKDLVLTINNTGSKTLTVTAVTSSNPDYAALVSQFDVPGGGSYSDTIRFTPSIVGARSGSLSIMSNAATSPDEVLLDGSGTEVNAVRQLQASPGAFTLFQNYPNPFHPSTTIRYDLETSAPVRVTVLNALGQVVATLVDARQDPGAYTVRWMSAGSAPGVYFYVLRVGADEAFGTMVLMK